MVKNLTGSWRIVLAEGRVSLQEAWARQLPGVLCAIGADVESCASVSDAIEQIKSRPTHAIVLDTELPQCASMFRVLQAFEYTVPVVAIMPPTLTGAGDQRVLQRLLEQDAFTAVRRPVNLDTLLHALRRVLEQHSHGRWPV